MCRDLCLAENCFELDTNSRLVLDDLSHKIEQLELSEIDDLLILIPRCDDYDEEFLTIVTSWDEVRHFGRNKNLNFIPRSIGDLLKAKIKGGW